MKMEITVISAQGLKTTSHTLFSKKIRPFITLTATNGEHKCHVYRTGVDDEEGGINPTWGDKFHVPVDTSFFTNRYSCIYLQLYSKRLIMGRTQLGWCQISAQDIGFPPAGSARYLSYRLRARDGSRTNGIVNLSVKLENLGLVSGHGQPNSVNALSFAMCGTVIGTPVTALVPPLGECSGSCEGQLSHVGFGSKGVHRWAMCDSEGIEDPYRN